MVQFDVKTSCKIEQTRCRSWQGSVSWVIILTCKEINNMLLILL